VARLRTGVVEFLAALAGALAELAQRLGVPGARWQRDPAGLWLGRAKLAACGIHLSRRACSHGFAFNLATPASMWQLIVPCGLQGTAVTSIAAERSRAGLSPPPPMHEVAAMAGPLLCAALARVSA
jgi:lipoyl(octanoyl) transferase